MLRNGTRFALSLLLAIPCAALLACSGSGDDDGRTKPPPAGNIVIAFNASDASVATGGRVTLTWTITGVDSASVDVTATPGGPLVTGSTELTGSVQSAAIDADTTFTIKATSGSASKEETVSVTVNPNGITINTFNATPNPAPQGGTVLLSWSIAGATQVRITEGANELLNTTTDVANGTLSVEVPNATHTFTLDAQNASTAASESVTVTTEPAPEITYFAVTPATFDGAMADVSVTWTAKGNLTLTANGTDVANFPGTETGTITVSVTDTTTFELTATGAGLSVEATRLVAKTQAETEPNDDAANANALTGSAAAGTLTDDTDVDWYSFTVPANGNVFLQVNAPDGDCSDDADVVLVDTDGMTDLGGTGFSGGCFNITPQSQGFAAELPAGTYYARVESLFGGSGPYTLIVIVGDAACGNEIIETTVGEQCDDGNTTDGDGCSSTCQVQPSATVMGIGQDQTIQGAIDPATNQDFIQVVLDAPGNIFAETGVPTLGLCEGDGMRDTRIYLLDSAFAELGDNDDGGPGLCSAIDPNFDDFAANLAAGTYYVRVQSYNGNSRIPAYEVRVRTTQAMGCGNGVVEEGEQCDDFNVATGDGCDASCQLEVAGMLSASGNVQVTLGGPNDTPRFVSVTIAQAGATITATITDGAGNCPVATDMALLSDDLAMTLGGRAGGTGCSYFGPPEDTFSTDLPAGKYMIGMANADAASAGASITLEVTIENPQCGNGRIETNAGEQCDDMNTTPGDGCDGSCQFENVASEMEPNNDSMTATPTGATRGGPVVTLTGGINPIGDHDYYSFTVPAGQTATIEALTYGQLGDTSVCGFDTVLTVYDAQGQIVTENDDADRGLCSTIDGTTTGASGLAAGTYYIQVQDYSDDDVIATYLLDVRLVP